MPNDLEYLVHGAYLTCDKGALPVPFTPTSNTHIKISKCLVSTSADKIPMANISSFGACSVKNGSPCVPAPTAWKDTYKVKVKGQQTLLFKSSIQCSTGGKIAPITSGQVPISPEELDSLLEEHGEEEDSGWGFWDFVELVPVVGSVVGIVREAAKGNWGMVAMNVGFLAMDIAGVVSFGATTAAATAAKAGVKAGIKTAAKAAAKATSKAGLKAAGKAVSKGFATAVGKAVDKIALSKSVVCVTACFVEGTCITTDRGKVKIEQIAIGDKVLAFNSKNGKNEYQKVTNTVVNKVDYILKLKFHNEEIVTTEIHPFYVNGDWILAEKLQVGTMVTTEKGRLKKILSIERIKQVDTIVYNLEINNLHNFYVGENGILVHNGPCEKGLKWMVGKYDELAKMAKGVGLDSHHLVQAEKMKALLGRVGKNFDYNKGASILVPLKGHRRRIKSSIKTLSRWTSKKSNKYIDDALAEGKKINEIGRDLMAKDIKEMRRVYKDVPNKKLKELIELNKKNYPEIFKK
ncbi:polymorphic toxin-type HINT domain-containing protein [Aquimarina sediminis]|uniref:polymorphic toxin-type HINT domain-containing protein n=1 Tax=Aquimarina sediminis TaxID=2070536 RepID=UPI000CA03EF7|nr:polymorphic toxin-type HINT domain-containing protein [Aquimarina sediminis]